MNQQTKLDQDLILIFLSQFNRFEKELIQAGFTQESRPREADWQGFIASIKERFDPKAAVELEHAVDFLLAGSLESSVR